MNPILNRRRFLTSSLAIAGSLSAAARGLTRPAVASPLPLPLTAVRRNLDVNGKPASVFGLLGPDGAPGLAIDAGQRFTVTLQNRSGEDTIIHWHGQTPPNPQDGVAETGSDVIRVGAASRYDFAARPGTHWMHSHHGLQEQALMAAPLIVRSKADLSFDAQEVTLLLHDFSFREPAELLNGVMKASASHGGGMNMSGMSMPDMPGMSNMGTADMPGMSMSGPGADLNDVDYDAYLANDRTLADPLVVRTERGGRVRLRLINGATSTAFWIDLGGIEATVLAVDGNAVQPITARRFPMAQGQRLDLMIVMPAGGGIVPVLAQREGDQARTGIILASPGAYVPRIAETADTLADAIDLSLERRLSATEPLAIREADTRYQVVLSGSMNPYEWLIDGRTWPNHEALRVKQGQRVAIEMVNHSMMAHPMHLHGHHFQVVALNGHPVRGAMRDTVLVPPHMGRVTIAFDADNPGRWVFHCHNLLHMATGMMTEVAYDDLG